MFSRNSYIIRLLECVYKCKLSAIEIIDNDEAEVRGNFARGTKQQIKLQTFVKGLPKCPICGGYMDNYSISIDHIIRKEDGGTNAHSNAQMTHLYRATA